MTNSQGPCRKRRRSALYNLVETVKALFNHESSSDLTLLVNGTKFFCHRIVLVPLCDYVKRFLHSPVVESENNGGLGPSDPLIKIDLPDFEIPESFHTVRGCSTAVYFTIFLKLVYGLHELNPDNPAELFIIAQIADFIVCESMLKFCDDILSTICYNKHNVLDVALFCQKYPLPNTFQVVKKFIADNIRDLQCDPKLYEIQHEHFFDIMNLPTQSRYQQFFAVYCYATGQIPVKNNKDGGTGFISSGIRAIKDANKRKLFQEVVSESSTKWDQQTLVRIVKYFSNVDQHQRFGGSAEDRAFLSEILNTCYYRLYIAPN